MLFILGSSVLRCHCCSKDCEDVEDPECLSEIDLCDMSVPWQRKRQPFRVPIFTSHWTLCYQQLPLATSSSCRVRWENPSTFSGIVTVETVEEEMGWSSAQFFSHHFPRFVLQHNNGEKKQIIIIVCYSGRLTRLFRPGFLLLPSVFFFHE